jgi:hypothetical protein
MNKTLTNLDLDTIPYEPMENTNWGFTLYSEKINGRVAMMAFVFLFLIELTTKQKITQILN